MTALYRKPPIGVDENVKEWKERAEAAENEVERLKKKIDDLEGELDVLASRLAASDITMKSTKKIAFPVDVSPKFEEYAPLQEHGKAKALLNIPRAVLKGAAGGSNCLAVAQQSMHAVAVSGADSSVRLLAGEEDTNFYERSNTKLTAPAIVLRWNPMASMMVATCMDGQVHVLSEKGSLLASYKYHTKFVVDAAWSPDGKILATCARDKTVVLSRISEDDETKPLEKFKSFELPASAESLSFTKSIPYDLILAVRGEPFLRYIDLETLSEVRVSLNDNPNDTHVSFDVLSLAPSPDNTFLAVATSKNQHIVYKLRDHRHTRILVGHSSDDFANTRIAWLSSDSAGGNNSLVSNSNSDCSIYQWDLASSKLLSKISRAHEQPVRNLDVFQSSFLATASFDKSVKLWSLEGQ